MSFLSDEGKAHLDALGEANRAFMRHYPGEREGRQPVHTVYGGAHLFRADTPRRLGELALQALATYAPDGATLAAAIGLPPAPALDAAALQAIHARVTAKLQREP